MNKNMELFVFGFCNLGIILLCKQLKILVVLTSSDFSTYIKITMINLLLSIVFNSIPFRYAILLILIIIYTPYCYLVGEVCNMNAFWNIARSNIAFNMYKYLSFMLLITAMVFHFILITANKIQIISMITTLSLYLMAYAKNQSQFIDLSYKFSKKVLFLSFFSIVSIINLNTWKLNNLDNISSKFAQLNLRIAQYSFIFSPIINGNMFILPAIFGLLCYFKVSSITLILLLVSKYLFFDLGKEKLNFSMAERRAEYLINFISKIIVGFLFLFASPYKFGLFINIIWILLAL